MNRVKKLSKVIARAGGVKYVLVKRGKKALIYKRVANGLIICYEVFKIKIRKQSIVNGRCIQAQEKFPHNEAIGKWGKCLLTLERAIEVFNQYENA